MSPSNWRKKRPEWLSELTAARKSCLSAMSALRLRLPSPFKQPAQGEENLLIEEPIEDLLDRQRLQVTLINGLPRCGTAPVSFGRNSTSYLHKRFPRPAAQDDLIV